MQTNTVLRRNRFAGLTRFGYALIPVALCLALTVSQALALTWTPRTSGTSNRLLDVVYAGSQFVAVGDSGTILTSPDGVTWTARTSGTSDGLWAVGYGGGLFVAAGMNGRILTSPDGVTWTSQTSGTTNVLRDIAYYGGTFVMVGMNGTIRTSSDGTTWTTRTSNTTEHLYGVGYGAGKFVAVGFGGTIRTSPDGVTWTARTSPAGDSLQKVAYDGSRFMVPAYSYMYTSTDGIAWTWSAYGTAQYSYAVMYDGGQFVVVGYYGRIYTSPDGSTWTQDTSGTSADLYGVAYDGSQYLAVGSVVNSSGTILAGRPPVTCTASASGDWSIPATWSCGHVPGAGEQVVIPAGFTVTLDTDITLDSDLDVQGTLVPNGKTVTLTGSAAQTLKGSPPNMTFYNLVVNKTNTGDTVTIEGKLKVTKKLTVTKGKLKSASDYEDIEIGADGELELTSDISVGGNFTIVSGGTFTPNGFRTTFDGAKTQNMTLGFYTDFEKVTVAAGTVLVETDSSDSFFVSGELINNGVIQKTQTIDAMGDQYFGLAGRFNSADVDA